jgi:ParB-like chromosome segregation protein Spo0J
MPVKIQREVQMPVRDRVKELRRVRAGELKGAPWNWRRHGDRQRNAVVGSLEELGITDPLKARELPDGTLELWDGHLRQDILARVGPDTLIPVIVTDLTESEAKKANLIHDPLAELAESDAEKLDSLIQSVDTDNAALAELLDDLAGTATEGVIQDLADGSTGESGDDDEDAEEQPAAEYRHLTLALTVAQELEVRKAIKTAKAHFGCATSPEAVVSVMKEWLDAHRA